MDSTRRVAVTLAVAAALVLTSCSGLPRFGSEPSPAPPATTAAATPAASTSGQSSATPGRPAPAPRNDLRRGTLKRTFAMSKLTVSVDYTTPLPVARWTPGASKPLNISLSAVAKASRAQKIYLTRVTAVVAVSDDSGPLDAPQPLVDTAAISPGFIVTSPNSYGQILVIPPVDEGATSITVDFTYEFLLQVSPSSKDYEKQTGRDSLTVSLS